MASCWSVRNKKTARSNTDHIHIKPGIYCVDMCSSLMPSYGEPDIDPSCNVTKLIALIIKKKVREEVTEEVKEKDIVVKWSIHCVGCTEISNDSAFAIFNLSSTIAEVVLQGCPKIVPSTLTTDTNNKNTYTIETFDATDGTCIYMKRNQLGPTSKPNKTDATYCCLKCRECDRCKNIKYTRET
jgi:hypothetical protein